MIKMWKTLKDWSKKKEIEVEEIKGVLYPTEQTIIKLHDYIIRKLRLDENEIHEGTISTGVLSFEGIKYYFKGSVNKREDLLLRGARIFNKFLQEGHPFVDGNKRTGFVTLWLFLILNGIRLKLSLLNYKEQAKQIEKWADIKIKREVVVREIYTWLDENIQFI